MSWPWMATAGLVLVALLTGCGGGGGANPSPGSPPAASANSSQLSGSVVKGPVTGARVCVYALTAGAKGKELGCTQTDATGAYAMDLPYEGEVVVEATGGTYTDEATGQSGVPLTEPLRSAGRVGGGASTLHATPWTAMALAQVGGSLDLAKFEAKAKELRDALGLPADVDLAATLPKVTGQTNAYGESLRSLSKMLGMGATLAGVVGQGDLKTLKASLLQAQSCLSTPQPRAASASAAGLLTATGPVQVGGTLNVVASGGTGGTGSPGGSLQISGSGNIQLNGGAGQPGGSITVGGGTIPSTGGSGSLPPLNLSQGSAACGPNGLAANGGLRP